METWQWSLALKPVLALILFGLVIAPIAWVIRRSLPEGRLKAFLTKDRTRATAPLRDRVIYGAIIIGAFIALLVYGAISPS